MTHTLYTVIEYAGISQFDGFGYTNSIITERAGLTEGGKHEFRRTKYGKSLSDYVIIEKWSRSMITYASLMMVWIWYNLPVELLSALAVHRA